MLACSSRMSTLILRLASSRSLLFDMSEDLVRVVDRMVLRHIPIQYVSNTGATRSIADQVISAAQPGQRASQAHNVYLIESRSWTDHSIQPR
jgi:hypothetical protein